MKIAVISTPVFKVPVAGYSGLEHLAWLTAKGLAEKGHDVTLVAPEGSECPGVKMVTPGPEGTWDEKTFYGKYWQILPEFDVIIDETWQKWSYILKGEGRLNAPILGVCHAPVNTMYGSLPPGVDKPCFVCISRDQAAHFEALHSRPARVAYNGVDMDFYKPLGVPRSDRFLFLARFSTIKGPDLAIQACKRVGCGLDLIGDTSITGEPEFLERCKKMCDSWVESNGSVGGSMGGNAKLFKTPEDMIANQDKMIRLVGPAKRGETVWWFSQAHCLLHPNQRFREPFGLAPVEAMACGCPVIAWDNGAMRETIKNGETGWLVRSMDEMVLAVETYSKIGWITDITREKCREWASQFSLPKMIDRYEELINEAVDTGGW